MDFEMDNKDKAEIAVSLLKEKYSQLKRIPKRSDFSPETVCFIKQKLGPWPRALEAAGLKEPPKVSAKDKSRIKRERRKKLIKKQKRLSYKEISDDINNVVSEKKTEE